MSADNNIRGAKQEMEGLAEKNHRKSQGLGLHDQHRVETHTLRRGHRQVYKLQGHCKKREQDKPRPPHPQRELKWSDTLTREDKKKKKKTHRKAYIARGLKEVATECPVERSNLRMDAFQSNPRDRSVAEAPMQHGSTTVNDPSETVSSVMDNNGPEVEGRPIARVE
ncbi:hypothetical protein B0H19DRAFT_1067895 [Mycena capillaripes]|nr:hypothetical protein B0H19DRAFT_1067895 [Mycena capillaripes]